MNGTYDGPATIHWNGRDVPVHAHLVSTTDDADDAAGHAPPRHREWWGDVTPEGDAGALLHMLGEQAEIEIDGRVDSITVLGPSRITGSGAPPF